jgi:alkylation response protein AidB-like acyl-CoA dehydrogenase
MSCQPRLGETGRVYYRAWHVSAPRPRQWSSGTASASTRGLCHRLGNALNGAGIEVTTKLFELTGGRSTARSFELDRFFRDLHTQSLHGPVAQKQLQVGAYLLRARQDARLPGWR